MKTTSPLPTNWSQLLDQIQQLLTQATQLAEARESSLADQTVHGVSLLPPDVLNARLEELAKRVKQMENPLTTLDQTLKSEEDHARGHLAKVADLSQRLAEWAGGAVG